MKQFSLTARFVLGLFLFISCQPNDWYVGKWTDGTNTFILTKDRYIDGQGETNSSITIVKRDNGVLCIYVDDFANEGGGHESFILADPKHNTRLLLAGESEEGGMEVFSEYRRVNDEANKYSELIPDAGKSNTKNEDEGNGDLVEEDGLGDYIDTEWEVPIEEMGFDQEDFSNNLIIVIDKEAVKEIPNARILYFNEDCGVSVEQWKKRGYASFKPLKMEERDECIVLHYSWVTKPTSSWVQTDLNDIIKKASKVSLPEGVESGYIPLDGNTSYLRSVFLPNSVTYIPSKAYSGCTNLSSISLPKSLKHIEDDAFYGCINLTQITLPESLETIGQDAFRKCGLSSISIPSSLTGIGNAAFAECAYLKEITFPSTSNLKRIDGFEGCGISQISLPNSIQVIGAGAFSECRNLVRAELGNVTSIEYGAFQNCPYLSDIVIPESVTEIGEYAFANCSRLRSFFVPNGVKFIREGTFQNCSSLNSITIPDSVTNIGEKSFEGCSSLTALELPNTIANIGNMAFKGSGLIHFVIPESIMYMVVSYGDGRTSRVKLNEGSIGLQLFAYCSNLKSVQIPEGITHIYDSAFEGCTSLTSINLPKSLRSISKKAFKNTGLTEIVIPESVNGLNEEIFRNCPNLKRVVLSERLRNQMREYGNQVFPSGVELSYY